MEFNLPTTKSQMYTILNDLFYYYRVRREGFEEVNLQELVLERLSYTPITDSEIFVKAGPMLAPEQRREFLEYTNSLVKQITEIDEKIGLAESNAQSEIDSVTELYNQSIEKVENQALKAGLINSSVVVDKTAVFEDSKNAKIAVINAKKNALISELNATKTALNNQLSSAESDYNVIFQADIEKKVSELKDERANLSMEVFKYNNGLDEKEQRYANSIKQTKASLQLRFLDIRAGEFTKDELVEMGYYEDVMKCVCGYYDTLSATAAYQDISNESKLAIYLDDYYPNIIYLYKSRAGF